MLDTNVLVSTLLMETSRPAALIALWRKGKFDVLTAAAQLEELMRVTRYPRIRERLNPALTGRLINALRDLAVIVQDPPTVEASPYPYDNYLLSIAVGGRRTIS